MALTNGKYQNSGNLIFLSPRSTKLVDGKQVKIEPHFEISRIGEDGKIKQTDQTATEITGDLIKIELKERIFKDVPTKHAILYIKDGEETYYLDLTYRLATRSLFNSLLNLKNPKGIVISYYESKKGYESFALRQNDELLKWKHDLKDLPQAEQIKDKKGVVIKTDYSEVDQFFETELIALAEALFGAQPEKAEKKDKTAPKNETATAPVDGQAKVDDDVPF